MRAQVLTCGTNYPSASSDARTDSPSYGWAYEKAAFALLTHLTLWVGFLELFLNLLLAIFLFVPSLTSLLVSALIYSLGQKLIKLSQAVKNCTSVNGNQTHSHHEVGNLRHHHKTEIYLPLNLGFLESKETHKHKAHNIKLKNPQISHPSRVIH